MRAIGSERVDDDRSPLFGPGEDSAGRSLSAALLCALLGAAFLFIPAARYRTAFFPAFLFAAAASAPGRRELPAWAAASIAVIAVSVLVPYPGAPRTGLTELQAAQEHLERSEPTVALDLLHEAAGRGYEGADLHNIAGASLMMLGRTGEGIAQFREALEIAPGSPSLWRNTSVALWNSGDYEQSVSAARRAVELDPRLSIELAPVLSHGAGDGI